MLGRHNLEDDEKKAYIEAELCLMNSPPKSGIEVAENRWDEITYSHLIQSNFMHRVVSLFGASMSKSRD